MTRSMMAGSTDYSHQSFDDMVADLNEWISNLTEVNDILEKSEGQLKETADWKKVGYDVQHIFGYSNRFFKTAIEEVSSILVEFQVEVQPNHITRIRSLAKTASSIDRDIGKIWHEDLGDKSIDYGDPNFAIAEEIYKQARGMATDMIDLGNLASRLNDFIGRKGQQLRQSTTTESRSATLDTFVDPTRLAELRVISSTSFDLSKLVQLCEELNSCYATGCYMATAMLVRAILDHIPPIFGVTKFAEVASNYKGPKSFRESMKHLENSQRDIADHHLHVQIRNKESIPNKTQVNFSADLDVLLAEIVRLLKSP